MSTESLTLGRLRIGSRGRGKSATIGAVVGILGMQELVYSDVPSTDWLTRVPVAQMPVDLADKRGTAEHQPQAIETMKIDLVPALPRAKPNRKPVCFRGVDGEELQGAARSTFAHGLDADQALIDDGDIRPLGNRARVRAYVRSHELPDEEVCGTAFGGAVVLDPQDDPAVASAIDGWDLAWNKPAVASPDHQIRIGAFRIPLEDTEF